MSTPSASICPSPITRAVRPRAALFLVAGVAAITITILDAFPHASEERSATPQVILSGYRGENRPSSERPSQKRKRRTKPSAPKSNLRSCRHGGNGALSRSDLGMDRCATHDFPMCGHHVRVSSGPRGATCGSNEILHFDVTSLAITSGLSIV
jgi:hypothetical protein